MKSELTKIWRWNGATGYWALVRDTYLENAAAWLRIFKGDEPGATFKARQTRPVKAPKVAK